MSVDELSLVREFYYEADTRKHQQLVANELSKAVVEILRRANEHDKSKLELEERQHYVDPVWILNNEGVPYGSERYKELTGQMGLGWKHHKYHNDHHPKALEDMNLFSLLEMICDWIAASKRRGNDPAVPIQKMKEDLGMTAQLESVLRNTIKVLETL